MTTLFLLHNVRVNVAVKSMSRPSLRITTSSGKIIGKTRLRYRTRTNRLNALWWRVGSTTFTIATCWTFCWERRLQSTRIYCKEITFSTIACWRSLKGLVNWKLMLNELFNFEFVALSHSNTRTHWHIKIIKTKTQQNSGKTERKWEIYAHPALASAVTAVKSSHQTFKIDGSKWQRRQNGEFKNRRERW